MFGNSEGDTNSAAAGHFSLPGSDRPGKRLFEVGAEGGADTTSRSAGPVGHLGRFSPGLGPISSTSGGFPVIFWSMAETVAPTLPVIEPGQEDQPRSDLEPGYLVICWNDPVNLMVYVSHVFQRVFGWPRRKAEFHMLQVHEQGKSVLVRESLEKAEHYVHQLQQYSLHATLERDE